MFIDIDKKLRVQHKYSIVMYSDWSGSQVSDDLKKQVTLYFVLLYS